MKTYNVIQAFLVAPSVEDPSVNSGLDTWSFATEAEAVSHYSELVEALQTDPDYQIGDLGEGLEVVHVHGVNSQHHFQIDVSQDGKPYEAVYVEVVEVKANGELTWWSHMQDRHQKNVANHFLNDGNETIYAVSQSAVADDEVGNLVASSIITWSFNRSENARELIEMLKNALQEDYAPIEEDGLRIVHFTGLDSSSDYRIEVSENGVPTEVVMVELHIIQPNTGGETWWSEQRHQHQEALTKRFFAQKH